MNKKINLTKLDVSPAYLGLSKQTNKIYFYLKIANKIQEITYLIKDTKNYHQELIAFIKKYSKENKIKIFALGLAGFDDFEEIATKMWQILDIVPRELKIKDKALKIHAQKACRLADSLFDDEIKPINFLDKHGLVKEQFLTNLNEYKKIAEKEDWDKILQTAEVFKKNNLQAAFINSTAAGGGVSLMRHALIRLYSLLGVNMKWIVLKGDKDVFNITKKKIHNVLHGVAAYNIMLNKEDKKKYREWIKDNYRRIKKVISKLNVVIIDDPQPSGLIPLIKKDFPHIKIIYRSHIQIYSELIERGVKQNKNTWDFVWGNAKLADIFISHPIAKFVPSDVPENKVLYLPATTDKLDGLNKKIKNDNKKYYFKLFNSILKKSGLKPLDTKRPYIIQVARFDPSKGIPDVIETYRKLRKNLIKKEIADKDMPQLVIVGNGANDDPESMPIYHETRRTIEMDTFKEYKDDIKVARLPHNDQLLNVLLDNALVALQLSHREGFEIKVTEALLKGVPIVAYRTGGIPLQIEDGKTGYLVPRKRTKLVAKRIEELFLDKIKCQEISNNAKNNINDNYLTINSAYRWMLLVILLSFRKNIDMKSRKFADLENKYLPDILADLK
ncbi:MAG TPA: glycosyltransferase [Patescibacteria group bacterium]|nr:glycosyltransferase [Patescibacteria group bacterium]